jgi:hypothetical protein
MLADSAEHPEPSETTPTPGAAVRTRAVTRHSGGAASVGALAMGAVVLAALTVGAIAMRRTAVLSDRAEHPQPSETTPVLAAPTRTRAVMRHTGGPLHWGRLPWAPWPSGLWPSALSPPGVSQSVALLSSAGAPASCTSAGCRSTN